MGKTIGALISIGVCVFSLAACSPPGTNDASGQKVQLNSTVTTSGNANPGGGGGGGGGGGY